MKMQQATLWRFPSCDDGTFGILISEKGFGCYVVELPDHNNKPYVSRTPEGDYIYDWIKSPKHGWCYEARKVKARTHIQWHSANWAGDKSKGFKSQLLGCHAPGRKVARMRGQRGVTSSSETTKAMAKAFGKKSFRLKIRKLRGERP